jgi:hypothetical protein
LCATSVSAPDVRSAAVLPTTDVRAASHVRSPDVRTQAVLSSQGVRRRSPHHDSQRYVQARCRCSDTAVQDCGVPVLQSLRKASLLPATTVVSPDGYVPAAHVRASALLPAARLRHGLLPSGHGRRHGCDATPHGVWPGRTAARDDETHGQEQQERPPEAAPGRTG